MTFVFLTFLWLVDNRLVSQYDPAIYCENLNLMKFIITVNYVDAKAAYFGQGLVKAHISQLMKFKRKDWWIFYSGRISLLLFTDTEKRFLDTWNIDYDRKYLQI